MRFLVLMLLSVFRCAADGPEMNQQVWLSNGAVFASADIPACHYARWERRILPSTNWFRADSADYEFFTRRVVFSEPMPSAAMSWYRIAVIYVPWCATLDAMTTMSPCATLWPIKL